MFLDCSRAKARRLVNGLIFYSESAQANTTQIQVNGLAQVTAGKDFADMTQKLNYVISRFAFHEMRVHASSVLSGRIKSYIDSKQHDNAVSNAQANMTVKPGEALCVTKPCWHRLLA